MKTITQVQFAPAMPKRLRAAAYARVSSGKDAMLHSLSAQVSYYSALIQERADWAFAGIYCDEAVTGTKDNRAEFQRMLEDCRAGKIDQIITKSITRFARNTLTTLETVRELKILGVDVYFEEQNLHTMSNEGEMILAILAASAQEGSLRVSENCKWRIRKEFQAGRLTGGLDMLGYKLIDGKLHILPEEAEIVRRIFADYLSGMGLLVIIKSLRAEGITLGRAGLRGLLQNEKYTGNMLLQKTYVIDHLSKRKKINRGELPQYFVEGSHEAIIPQETFDAVQREIARRHRKYPSTKIAPGASPLTGLVRCGICGAAFQRKNGGATGYKKQMWICSTFNGIGKQYCANQQIPEDILLAKAEEAGGFAGLKRITATGPGALSFIYKDRQGERRVDLTWQNPSRAQSWTPEMKEAARQKSLAIAKKRKEEQEKNP
jgi:DNA invertase Pin-like site-specific DNA recombinase